jgi:hypothetical protein
MQNRFQYSVLYYQPSQLVEERFAVGLLFFLPDEQEISLLTPKNLNKLKNFLPDSDIGFLRLNLVRLRTKANKITQSWNKYLKPVLVVCFEDIINFEFLVPDSSALYFSEPKSGIVTSSSEQLKEYYYQLYFQRYLAKEEEFRITESIIKSQFSILVKEKIPSSEKFVEADVQIKGRFFTEQFSYGWQNGKYNLVAPISFDLSEEGYIKRKSQEWIGVLTNLEEAKNDFNLDLIIARPKNSSLLQAYENALSILDEFSHLSKVYNQEELESYVELIKVSAKPLITV